MHKESGAPARYVLLPILFLLLLGLVVIVGSWNFFIVASTQSAVQSAQTALEDIAKDYKRAGEKIASGLPPLASVQQDAAVRAKAYELIYHASPKEAGGMLLVLDDSGKCILGDERILGKYYDLAPSAPHVLLSRLEASPDSAMAASLLCEGGGRDLLIGRRVFDGYLLFILFGDDMAGDMALPAGLLLADNFGNVVFQSGGEYREGALGRLAPVFSKIDKTGLVSWSSKRYYVGTLPVLADYRLYAITPVDEILTSYLIGFLVLLLASTLFVPLILVNLRRASRAGVRAVREEGLARLAVAERKQLESQFNPHFLFNTLQTIRFMVELRPKEAVHVIELLSEILRYSIKGPERVTIGEDLKYIESYMEIQRLRFGKRLAFSKAIPENVLKAYIPRLVLQPVLENAVLHGADAEGKATICLAAWEEEDALRIVVEDRGKGMEEMALARLKASFRGEVPEKGHIGLWNVNRRLNILYGAQYGMELEQQGQGLKVSIRLPLERRDGDAAGRHC